MTSFRSVINGSTESVVLAVNLGHDGAVAVLQDGSLEFSIEAEKNSYPRYSTAGPTLLFDAFQQLKRSPDIVAIGFLRLPRLAHFQMRLHQLPQQILPHRAQLSFQIAVAQLARLPA
jgi:predicted NodU family carbamoyl transferase